MLLTVCLTGTRGDVQPSLAVAKGLRAAGFEIRVASMPNYQEFVESHGFEFHPVGIDFQEASPGKHLPLARAATSSSAPGYPSQMSITWARS